MVNSLQHYGIMCHKIADAVHWKKHIFWINSLKTIFIEEVVKISHQLSHLQKKVEFHPIFEFPFPSLIFWTYHTLTFFPLMEIYGDTQTPVAFKTFESHKWDRNSLHNVYRGLEPVQAVWTLILLMCHQHTHTIPICHYKTHQRKEGRAKTKDRKTDSVQKPCLGYIYIYIYMNTQTHTLIFFIQLLYICNK